MSLYVAQAVIFFIIFFLGVLGNSIVLYVLLRSRGSWNITTTYLFNLAIADTLFLCFLPFWGHYHLNDLHWTFGTAMCKAAGTMTYINMYASIFFLTAMSLDRWTAIVHATRMNRHRSSISTRYICVSIWFVSVTLCLPSMLYRVAKPGYVSSCDNLTQDNSSVVNQTLLPPVPDVFKCMFYIPLENKKRSQIMGTIEFIRSVLGFLIPLFVISYCYTKIVLIVRKKVISKRVRKDRVAKLAAFVIGAFIFCWTPYHVMNLYSALGGWWKLFKVDPCFYSDVKPFTVCLAYANSCINPIVYAFTTTNFQENVRDICATDKRTRAYRMVVSNNDKHTKIQEMTLSTRHNQKTLQKRPEVRVYVCLLGTKSKNKHL